MSRTPESRADGSPAESSGAASRAGVHGYGLVLCAWDAESDGDVDAWFRGRSDPEFRRWNTPLMLDEGPEGARESLRRRAETDAERHEIRVRAAGLPRYGRENACRGT